MNSETIFVYIWSSHPPFLYVIIRAMDVGTMSEEEYFSCETEQSPSPKIKHINAVDIPPGTAAKFIYDNSEWVKSDVVTTISPTAYLSGPKKYLPHMGPNLYILSPPGEPNKIIKPPSLENVSDVDFKDWRAEAKRLHVSTGRNIFFNDRKRRGFGEKVVFVPENIPEGAIAIYTALFIAWEEAEIVLRSLRVNVPGLCKDEQEDVLNYFEVLLSFITAYSSTQRSKMKERIGKHILKFHEALEFAEGSRGMAEAIKAATKLRHVCFRSLERHNLTADETIDAMATGNEKIYVDYILSRGFRHGNISRARWIWKNCPHHRAEYSTFFHLFHRLKKIWKRSRRVVQDSQKRVDEFVAQQTGRRKARPYPKFAISDLWCFSAEYDRPF